MKKQQHSQRLSLAVVLLGLTTIVAVAQGTGDKPPGKVGPAWSVGDTWTVRATAIQSQDSTETEQQEKAKTPVDWRFIVVGKEDIKDRPCFRVSVTCLDEGRQQPITTLWFDVDKRTLSRVEAKIVVKGSWHVFTETYVAEGGKPTPVLGPIPALPLDFPVFTSDGVTKDLGAQTYETIYGNAGTKSLGDVGFAFMVDQSVTPVKTDHVKSLAPESEGDSVVEVEIRGAGRSITQLWQPDTPWPIYSNNGMTEARLLEVKRADVHVEDNQQ